MKAKSRNSSERQDAPIKSAACRIVFSRSWLTVVANDLGVSLRISSLWKEAGGWTVDEAGGQNLFLCRAAFALGEATGGSWPRPLCLLLVVKRQREEIGSLPWACLLGRPAVQSTEDSHKLDENGPSGLFAQYAGFDGERAPAHSQFPYGTMSNNFVYLQPWCHLDRGPIPRSNLPPCPRGSSAPRHAQQICFLDERSSRDLSAATEPTRDTGIAIPGPRRFAGYPAPSLERGSPH